MESVMDTACWLHHSSSQLRRPCQIAVLLSSRSTKCNFQLDFVRDMWCSYWDDCVDADQALSILLELPQVNIPALQQRKEVIFNCLDSLWHVRTAKQELRLRQFVCHV